MKQHGAIAWLSWVAAVVGPVLVLLLAYRGLMAYHDEEDANAARNAGRIFNAKVIDAGAAAAMDELLAARRPDVVVLGPSYANTDVRPEIVASRLGLGKDDVALMSVPNSIGAHWYAVLKYRVFDAGYRPKLVIVVSGLQSMLLTTPLTESSFVNLTVQLPDGTDPVIAARIGKSNGFALARVREQRGKVRAAWFDFLRDAPLTSATALEPVHIRGALTRVFDEANVDMTLHGASTPVVEANRGLFRYYTPDLLPGPADSFLAEVTALVSSHGGRIVWVRPPMSPHIPAHLDDVVLPGVQEDAAAIIKANGGDFLDMRRLPMTSEMFKDEDHMSVEGSRRFSEAVGQALVDIDALYPALGPDGPPPLVTSVRTEGGTFSGQGVGVAPGATVVWSVEPWPLVRGRFAAEVLLERAGRMQGVTVTVDGKPMLTKEEEARPPMVRGHGFLGEWALPEGPFELAVHAAAGGPPLSIAAIALGRSDRRAFLVGDEASLRGRAVSLFAQIPATPVYAGSPVQVPGHDRAIIDLPGDVAAFDTERWAILSDEALQGDNTFGGRCSPFRITEDGRTLPGANATCAEVRHDGGGRSCHTTDRIFFTSSDGSDPVHNGRTYRIALDEARRCDHAVWLYAADEMRVVFPPASVATLVDGGHYLTLQAKYLMKRPAPLNVRLRVDGEVRVDAIVDGRDLAERPGVWRIDPPVPHDAREVAVELSHKSYVFYLIEAVTLSERRP